MHAADELGLAVGGAQLHGPEGPHDGLRHLQPARQPREQADCGGRKDALRRGRRRLYARGHVNQPAVVEVA
jgi:hypothetical protein